MEFSVKFTPSLVRRSVIAYWRHFVGLRFLVAVAALGGYATFLAIDGDRGWKVGALGVLAVIGIAMAAYSFISLYRRSIGALERLENGSASVRVASDLLRVESAAGATELRWSAVKSLRRHKGIWLFVLGPNAYFTLPLAGIPQPALEYMVERVRAAGGKVK